MMNSKTLFQDFVNKIKLAEGNDEIQSVGYLVFENIFGLTRAQIATEKEIKDLSLIRKLDNIIERINKHEPVQYILEEAWFYGRPFVVSPAVLIPRPETEELVRFVINYIRQTKTKKCRILDIGTGSGCIAVTLSLEVPETQIMAIDVSDDALHIAVKNAEKLGAKVLFKNLDILTGKLPDSIDVIVSNPPYIASSERQTIAKNVMEYEPHLALFVDANDPLLFYKAIAMRAKESLTFNGLLAVEINERFGKEVYQLFEQHKFQQVAIIQDVFGKDRIVKGISS